MWPRVRAGWRFNTTLRAGSPWWSSGGTTRDKRAPPVVDRPEERRAPTQRLEGTNPRTGRRYLLTLSATTSSSWSSANTRPRSCVAVVFWFGSFLRRYLALLFVFFHTSRGFAPLVTCSPCVRPRTSHTMPVAFLPSSIFFNSGQTVQLRSCYPQYRGTWMPGCQRCRFRVNGPGQGLGNN